MKPNPEIDNFIQDTLVIDEEKGEILISLRKMVLEIKPDAKEEIKYGGLVFIIDAKLICGIFIRKNHISVEFSFGATMLDPDNFLEGTGKYRRHLKIFQEEDIKNKKLNLILNNPINYKRKGDANHDENKYKKGYKEFRNTCILGAADNWSYCDEWMH